MNRRSTHHSVNLSGLMQGEMEKEPPPPPNIQQSLKEEGVDLPARSIMTRPGFGTSGRRVSLLSNHFKVSIRNPKEFFYQYSVKYKTLSFCQIYKRVRCI